jgi:hypothetical protein
LEKLTSKENQLNKKMWEALDRGRGRLEPSFFDNSKLLEIIVKTKGIDALNKIIDDVNLCRTFCNSYQLVLPIYILRFINELANLTRPKTHLDPWLTLSSPCNFFDFGKTTAYCIHMDEFQAIKIGYRNTKCETYYGNGLLQLDGINVKFDLITSLPPFGVSLASLGGTPIDAKRPTSMDFSSTLIVKSSQHLNNNGLAIFLVANSFFYNGASESALNKNGLYVSAIFAIPGGELSNTKIPSNLIVIKKIKQENYFVAELTSDEDVNRTILEGYKSNNPDGIRGINIDVGTYRGFSSIKAKQQIDKLEAHYEVICLDDFALDIKNVRSGKSLQEESNAIYIPKIGNSRVVCKLSDMTIKHHNYFQVLLDDKQVINEYLMSFFKTKIGKLSLELVRTESIIPHINKSEVGRVHVALPSLEEQKYIIQTHNKLSNLKLSLEKFDQELALNPTSSIAITSQLDGMLDVLDALTDSDKIRAYIREVESKRLEFKETLSLDLKKQVKEKYIEDSSLKTVAAFLNTDGGVLLVGVSDDRKLIGVDVEIKKFHKNNIDKFLLHLKNIIRTRIGEEYYDYIEYRLVVVEDKNILLVECKPSPSGCFLDKKDFYVRTNPATDKLEGPTLIEYVKNHF